MHSRALEHSGCALEVVQDMANVVGRGVGAHRGRPSSQTRQLLTAGPTWGALPTMCQALVRALVCSYLVFAQAFQDGAHRPPCFIEKNTGAQKGEVTGPGITASNWENAILASQGVCVSEHLYPEMVEEGPSPPVQLQASGGAVPRLCRLQLLGFQTLRAVSLAEEVS